MSRYHVTWVFLAKRTTSTSWLKPISFKRGRLDSEAWSADWPEPIKKKKAAFLSQPLTVQSQLVQEAGAAWRTRNVGVSRHTSPSWGQARGPTNSATTFGYKPNHPTLELKRCRSNSYPFGKRILIRAAVSKISNPPKRGKKLNWQTRVPALLWIPLRDIVG